MGKKQTSSLQENTVYLPCPTDLNSRKSVERANEGMRSKTQSHQKELDLHATGSRLVEHRHKVVWTLEGATESRIGWTSSWWIIPLRIIKYRETIYSPGSPWTKNREWERWENIEEVIVLPCTYISIKYLSTFGQYWRQDAEKGRPLIWSSVDLPSCTYFWHIRSQNSKKAPQWADDVRHWWNKQCELPTPHTGSERSVFFCSAFSELKKLHIKFSGARCRQKSAYLFAEKDSQS